MSIWRSTALGKAHGKAGEGELIATDDTIDGNNVKKRTKTIYPMM